MMKLMMNEPRQTKTITMNAQPRTGPKYAWEASLHHSCENHGKNRLIHVTPAKKPILSNRLERRSSRVGIAATRQYSA